MTKEQLIEAAEAYWLAWIRDDEDEREGAEVMADFAIEYGTIKN
jgi:hypothetical protein